jgi:cytochrome c biogenesis protein CcmG/thiol:disulfide interchange protein DsbE
MPSLSVVVTRQARRAAVGLLSAALLVAGCTSVPVGAYDPATGLGPLPQVQLARLGEPGAMVDSDSWRTTPTLINFWATWCAFCVEEMPALQAASELLAGQVRFIGIDRQDPTEDALNFLAETGVTYPQLASNGDYYVQLGHRGMPTTLFVDADGVVQYRHTGPLDEQLVLELARTHLGVDG